MPTPKEDRRKGKLLPTPVDPGTTVCFTIQIPNAVQYRAALLGSIGLLTQWSTWDHPTDGTVCADCETAAQLWSKALAEATFSDECELEMSCDDVADCIETSTAVKDALSSQFDVNGGSATTVYNTSYLGAPMTAANRNGIVTSAVDCDPDELFGSITAIVGALNTNNEDFLDIIQLSDNAQQRISKVIAAIPILGDLAPTQILDFISQMTVEIKENYEAQYTTALADTYRCDLFCIALDKPDCQLSFQDLVEYFNDRIGTSLEPINFFGSVVEYFLLGSWSGTTVVDILTLIQLAAWQQASNWTGISLRTLQVVGALGANDPDHDWAVLPCECAPEPLTPIIDPDGMWYAGSYIGNAGGTLTDLGDGLWRGTPELLGDGTYHLAIRASTGAPFKLENLVVVGSMICEGWKLPVGDYNDCSSTENYAEETIETIWWIQNNANPGSYVEFNMVAP